MKNYQSRSHSELRTSHSGNVSRSIPILLNFWLQERLSVPFLLPFCSFSHIQFVTSWIRQPSDTQSQNLCGKTVCSEYACALFPKDPWCNRSQSQGSETKSYHVGCSLSPWLRGHTTLWVLSPRCPLILSLGFGSRSGWVHRHHGLEGTLPQLGQAVLEEF